MPGSIRANVPKTIKAPITTRNIPAPAAPAQPPQPPVQGPSYNQYGINYGSGAQQQANNNKFFFVNAPANSGPAVPAAPRSYGVQPDDEGSPLVNNDPHCEPPTNQTNVVSYSTTGNSPFYYVGIYNPNLNGMSGSTGSFA